MNKKLLVLLIAVIPTLMPNLASAIAIKLPPEVGDAEGGTSAGPEGTSVEGVD